MVREYDYLAVGHLTLDELGGGKVRIGGAVAYGSAFIAGLGLSAGVVSVVGKDFSDNMLRWLKGLGVDLSGLRVSEGLSTRFRVIPGPKRVIASLISKAHPISVADVAPFRAKIAHLGPVAGEFSREVVLQSASSCGVLVVDLQGFLRRFGPFGRVTLTREGLSSLEGIRAVVHANELEASEATGLTDPVLAARALSRRFGTAAITLGEEGAVLAGPDEVVVVRPPAVEAVDDVGAGDVFSAALGVAFANEMRIEEAARLAVAAAAASTGFAGPHPIPRELIQRLERGVRVSHVYY